MKHWNINIFSYWVIGAPAKLKRTWSIVPVLQIVQKITANYHSCLNLSTGQVWWLCELWFKRYIHVSCANTHCDITDLVNHGMIKNTKTWISWGQNIIFLWNKKMLNLCFRWHILRSYCFVAEVAFNFHQLYKFKDISIYFSWKFRKNMKDLIFINAIKKINFEYLYIT